jgi:apolipoprotein N-acyltransferase
MGGSIGGLGFFFIGMSMIFDGVVHAGIGEVAVGAFAVAVAVILVVGIAVTFAELTPAGLAYRYNFRYKMIPWAAIESFRIARGPGTGPWLSLVVELQNDGPVLVGSVVGTRRYVARVIREIEAFRARPDFPASSECDQQSPDSGRG